MRNFVSLIDRSLDQRGQYRVIFVIACVPLISRSVARPITPAPRSCSPLQAAIDAASVGSIAKLSPARPSPPAL